MSQIQLTHAARCHASHLGTRISRVEVTAITASELKSRSIWDARSERTRKWTALRIPFREDRRAARRWSALTTTGMLRMERDPTSTRHDIQLELAGENRPAHEHEIGQDLLWTCDSSTKSRGSIGIELSGSMSAAGRATTDRPWYF